MANMQKQLKERKCSMCGRMFIFRDNWAYKQTYGDHVKLFCSWTCLRKKEKADEQKKTRSA